MAMDKMQAAEVLRGFARDYEAMVEAADALERMGSFEQAVAEAQARLVTKQRELEEATAALTRARSEATATLGQAKADAEMKLRKAGSDADALRSRAASEALELKESAMLAATQLREAAEADAQSTREAARLAKEQLDVLADERLAKCEALSRELNEKQAALDELNAKLGEAREQARRIIGA